MFYSPGLFHSGILQEIVKPLNLHLQSDSGSIQWINDFLIYSQDFDTHCKNLERLMKNVISKRTRLSAEKCKLIGSEAVFCGREI